MSTDLGLCQARIHLIRADGTDRCRRVATHKHYAFESGQTLCLCAQHRRALKHRERLNSSQALLDHWNGG